MPLITDTRKLFYCETLWTSKVCERQHAQVYFLHQLQEASIKVFFYMAVIGDLLFLLFLFYRLRTQGSY